LRVPRRPGDVGHAGPGDHGRGVVHRAGAPEAGAVVLALPPLVAPRGRGAVSCARAGRRGTGTVRYMTRQCCV
ncbi:hypothetical protein BAE44_0001501, partial [Dichanthelium oligosanthes]